MALSTKLCSYFFLNIILYITASRIELTFQSLLFLYRCSQFKSICPCVSKLLRIDCKQKLHQITLTFDHVTLTYNVDLDTHDLGLGPTLLYFDLVTLTCNLQHDFDAINHFSTEIFGKFS